MLYEKAIDSRSLLCYAGTVLDNTVPVLRRNMETKAPVFRWPEMFYTHGTEHRENPDYLFCKVCRKWCHESEWDKGQHEIPYWVARELQGDVIV